ncbi:hypothetical protein Dimus_038639 [Dionaea muscipula]
MSDNLSDVSTPFDMHHEPENQALRVVIVRKECLAAKRACSSMPPPFLLPADADHESDMKAPELASFPTRYQCPDYQFITPSSRDRPFDPKAGMMFVYEDSLRSGLRLPFCLYYQQILDWFQLSPAQRTPNSWGLLSAFGSLCYNLGFEPNPRSFCEFFTLKVVYKTEPCDFHSFSSRPNHVVIKGLPSKISFCSQWCWVFGPGITENPEWKGSASNIPIKIYAREDELARTMKEEIRANLTWDVLDLTDPISLRDAGLAPGIGPAPSSSSDKASNDDDETMDEDSDDSEVSSDDHAGDLEANVSIGSDDS